MSQTIIPDVNDNYARIVGQYAHFFDKPEVRLRFFNNTLAKQISNCEKLNKRLARFKIIEKSKLYPLILDWWLYVLIIREVKSFCRSESSGVRWLSLKTKVPFGAKVLFHAYKLRYPLVALGGLAFTAATVGLFALALN